MICIFPYFCPYKIIVRKIRENFFLVIACHFIKQPCGFPLGFSCMIHEFVDKIVVHEADKSTGDRIQQIDIYLKYVGKLDVPMPELTPEQINERYWFSLLK